MDFFLIFKYMSRCIYGIVAYFYFFFIGFLIFILWLVGILRRSDIFRLNQFYIEMTHDFCVI